MNDLRSMIKGKIAVVRSISQLVISHTFRSLKYGNPGDRFGWWSQMKRLAFACVFLLFWGRPVFAFTNIEADKVYDTAIKQQIEEEFTKALKMLKAQADALGMAPREKAITGKIATEAD
jgi:hypothetical protein